MAGTGYAARPRIGASGLVVALLTESSDVVGGTPVWGTIYSLTNATEINFDPAGSEATLAGDDGIAFVADNVGDMKITIGVCDISPTVLNLILGHSYANGMATDSTLDQSPYIAIGGKRLRSGLDGNGTAVYDYFWFGKCKLMKPKEEAKTKGQTIDFKTAMLEGYVTKLASTQGYRVLLRTDDANATSTTITNFFTQVVYSNSADLGAITVAVAKSTTKATFIFTKSGGGSITLTQANLTTATLPTYKGSTAIPIAGTYAITNNSTATVTVTFTPTVAYGAVSVSGSVVPNAVYDQNGVYASQAGALWTSD